MSKGSAAVLACAALLSVSCSTAPTPRAATTTIAGTYSGRYLCNSWNSADLQIGEAGRGRLQAVFTFAVDPRQIFGGSASYELSGQWDAASGTFELTPQRWAGRQPLNVTMGGLQGRFDPATRRLSGKFNAFGCGGFEMVAAGGAPLAPLPSGAPISPTARGPAVATTAPAPAQWGTEYWDAALDQGRTPRESEPIDDVIDWLKQQRYFCIASRRVSWDSTGTQAATSGKVDMRQRFVIECSGNCKGLRYQILTDGQLYGYGKAQPMPVFQLHTTWFGGTHVTWQFRRAPDGPPPTLYVHQWAGSGFAYGPGCKAPKSEKP